MLFILGGTKASTKTERIMGILSSAYQPELELFGDTCEVQTTVGRSNLWRREKLDKNYYALCKVLNMPLRKTPTSEDKICKLISAIILNSANIDDHTLTDDTMDLLAKLAKIIFPKVKTVFIHKTTRGEYINGHNISGIFYEDEPISLWTVQIQKAHRNEDDIKFSWRKPREAPYKRNKGNRITCERKVQRFREFCESYNFD